jgi:hypothetical protein
MRHIGAQKAMPYAAPSAPFLAQATPIAAALKSLIDQHGPPLVLKMRQRPAFKSKTFAETLAGHGITRLPSQPYDAVV